MVVAGVVSEPLNPQVDGHSLYLSAQGIARFELATGERSWHALADAYTFEPVVTEQLVLSGSTSGLYALDKATGEVRWQLPGATLFSPVVKDEVVYVGARNGQLTALVLTTGEVLWQRQYDGWVYVAAGDAGRLFIGGQGAELIALEASSGRELWRRAVSGELVYRPLVWRNESVMISTFDGRVMAFDQRAGSELWQRALGVTAQAPVLYGEQLLTVGFDATLYSLHPASGALRWQRNMSAGRWQVMPADATERQLMLSNDEGAVYLLDARTGEIAWHGQVSAQAPLASPVRYADQLVTPVGVGVNRVAELRLEALPDTAEEITP